MTTSQDIVEKYMTLIQAAIPDPNSERAKENTKWVYDDLPNIDINKYPRISIHAPASLNGSLDVGYNAEKVNCTVQILVWVKKKSTYVIDGVDRREVQAMEDLAKKIIDLVKLQTTRDTFRTMGVIEPILIAENQLQDDARYIKQLVYKNILIR